MKTASEVMRWGFYYCHPCFLNQMQWARVSDWNHTLSGWTLVSHYSLASDYILKTPSSSHLEWLRSGQMPRNLGMFHQWSFRRMQVQGTSMFASLFKTGIFIFLSCLCSNHDLWENYNSFRFSHICHRLGRQIFKLVLRDKTFQIQILQLRMQRNKWIKKQAIIINKIIKNRNNK